MIESIGHYSILSLLGAGGRGEVYRARDTKVGRTVAIRVIGQQSPDALQRDRFLHAIDALTRVSHPHLAALFETGQQDGQVYLVSEFVPGETLNAMLAGSPLNPRRAVDLAAQIAGGLAEAHAAGQIHQELTPSNIIVTPKGHAKVLDLGLSAWQDRKQDHQTAARLSTRGTALGGGAAAYMSPEQVLGQGVDQRSDLFTLGTILFEMLTGRRAFPGKNDSETAVQVLQSTLPPPSTLNPEVSPALDAIVGRATAKTIGDRFPNAAAMAEALRAASAAMQSSKGTVDVPASVARRDRRLPRAVLLAPLVILVLASLAWTFQEGLRQAWRSRFGPLPSPVVVVTPFQLEAEYASKSYYGAGLAEDLAMRLGQVRGLSVIGRPSIRSLAGRDPVELAREMQAGMVITGTLTPQDADWTGLTVRVTLLDGRDGTRAWSGQYDATPRDVLALQVRIVNDLVAFMRIPDQSRSAHERTALRLAEAGAYDLYLQAMQAASTGDSTRAAELYTNAIVRDPGSIEAQAGLAAALYASSTEDERASFGDVEPRVRHAAEQAATSDPDLPAARLATGLAASTLREALVQLRAAAEMDPSSAATFTAIGDEIRDVDPARALTFFLRAQSLDPTQALIHLRSASANMLAGQSDAAQQEIARGRALAPGSPWWDGAKARIALGSARRDVLAQGSAGKDQEFAAGWFVRAQALHALGRKGEALASATGLVNAFPGFCESRALLAALRWDAGEEAEARRLADAIFRAADAPGGANVWCRCAAMAAAAIADGDRAAKWLDRVASDDTMLHRWTTVNGLLSAQGAIGQRLFPWSNVTGHPMVVQALAALGRAIARSRVEVARSLDGLLETSKIADNRK